METIDIRGKLKRIKYPIIFDEIQSKLNEGLKGIEILELIFIELEYKRELVEILKCQPIQLSQLPAQQGEIKPDISSVFDSVD